MAYNSVLGRAEYTASAAQTVFPFAFKIYSTSDVKVYQTPAGQDADDVSDILIETTDYTVSINGDLGGEVTLLVGAGAGDAITLQRSLPVDRPIEYQENGDLLAATLNTDQDYQTYLIADKESGNTRFLKLPESAQGLDTQIPPPVPLNFFQWNSAGTAIVNVSSLQADGFIWTAADVYNKTEVNTLLADKADVTDLATKVDQTDFDDKSKLWDAQTTTHDFTIDADYTLTAAQSLYGRIILTDTGVVLTVARNVITDNIEKSFTVQNDTAQDITVKTLAGTGILILAGTYANLYNDGVNIYSLDNKFGELSINNMIHIQDQKTSGTNGGSSIAGTQTRDLNTVVSNTITGASLAANQITLPAGKYYSDARCPGYSTGTVRAIIYNATDASNEILGNSAFSYVSNPDQTNAFASGEFTLLSAKVIELRMYSSTANAADGLGLAVSDGSIEIYSDIKIWKVD